MSLTDRPPPYEGSMRRTKSERSHHHRPKPRKYVADPIDKLDDTAFGGPYHHGGPFDPTMRSFNIHPDFSPVAATMEGNMAAWEATPREAQLDVLLKHRPLDHVAVVPPGERAVNGQVMDYEDGTDMLRDPDAGGGAYNHWPGVQYHPDDLKGKGEPGFTIDRDQKTLEAAGIGRSQSMRNRERQNGEYEMVPQGPRRSRRKDGAPVMFRQRSASAAASTSRPRDVVEGLRRRIGSLKHR